MRKRVLLSVLGIILGVVTGAASSGGLEVTKPDGKTWAEGSKHSIKWTDNYGGANVRITLLYNGKFYKTLIASTPNDGRWVWKSIPRVLMSPHGASRGSVNSQFLFAGKVS